MNEMSRILATEAGDKLRFTTAEFLRICEMGAFSGMNIELVQGELERMPPPGNKHGLVQMAIIAQLLDLFGVARIRAEQAIDLGDNTLVGCDGAVLREPLRDAGILEPADLLLVIKMADSTVRRDLDHKRRIYATANVPNYWVADVERSVTRAHSVPVDGDYTTVNEVPFDEPLCVPGTDATLTLD